MKRILIFIFTLAILFLPSMVNSQMVKSNDVEYYWCEDILRKVESVAGCKCKESITVVIDDKNGFMFMGTPVFGLYEQDVRRITMVRKSLSPWLLAHEMAHVVFTDNYSFHPEEWADMVADMAVGEQPSWVKEN